MKRFRRKITWSLTALIAVSLIVLMGLVVAAQFFVVSRAYLTTEYTKKREIELQEAAKNWSDNYQGSIYAGGETALLEALNRYAGENEVYCFLFDEGGNVILASGNAGEFPASYIENTGKQILSDDLFQKEPPSFRIRNRFGIYTRYIGIGRILYHYGSDCGEVFTSGQTVKFVAVTREVYTSENYRILITYSLVLFVAAAAVSLLFAYRISRYVTKPILQIRDAARKMIGMDFWGKCEYHSENELGELAGSLNYLSGKLDETICLLEEANTKLKDDLDAQKEIDRMRRNFIAAASHEFKTPLTLLRGYLEMLQEGRLDGGQTQEAETVMIQEIDRLDRLVLDLLELSRLEAEHCKMETAPFELMPLLARVADTYRSLIESRGLAYRMEPEGDIPAVSGDRDGIERVIVNFLSNAVKYAAGGGEILLRVRADETGEASSTVTVSVFNPGAPIPENHLEHLWEPFYRADKSRARKTGGNGLGLAICADILKLHGSEYGVKNVPGGVKFFFTLQKA